MKSMGKQMKLCGKPAQNNPPEGFGEDLGNSINLRIILHWQLGGIAVAMRTGGVQGCTRVLRAGPASFWWVLGYDLCALHVFTFCVRTSQASVSSPRADMQGPYINTEGCC